MSGHLAHRTTWVFLGPDTPFITFLGSYYDFLYLGLMQFTPFTLCSSLLGKHRLPHSQEKSPFGSMLGILTDFYQIFVKLRKVKISKHTNPQGSELVDFPVFSLKGL